MTWLYTFLNSTSKQQNLNLHFLKTDGGQKFQLSSGHILDTKADLY